MTETATSEFLSGVIEEASQNRVEFDELTGKLLRTKVKARMLQQRQAALNGLLSSYGKTPVELPEPVTPNA